LIKHLQHSSAKKNKDNSEAAMLPQVFNTDRSVSALPLTDWKEMA
jgi:hypothetical protein